MIFSATLRHQALSLSVIANRSNPSYYSTRLFGGANIFKNYVKTGSNFPAAAENRNSSLNSKPRVIFSDQVRNFDQTRKLAEMSSPDVMLGKWRLEKSENFDEYLKACGSGMVMRGMAATESTAGTWCCEIKKLTDDMYNIKTSTATKSAEVSFKLDGKEVEEVTGDGRKCMTTMTWDDGTLYQKRKEIGTSKSGQLIRRFKGDEMEMECEWDNVKSMRIYKRDESCRV